jgi:hypothetical protein
MVASKLPAGLFPTPCDWPKLSLGTNNDAPDGF